jgi:hypothetical protein
MGLFQEQGGAGAVSADANEIEIEQLPGAEIRRSQGGNDYREIQYAGEEKSNLDPERRPLRP